MDNDERIILFMRNMAAELDLCDSLETPHVCANLQTPAGRTKIEKLIVEKVVTGHLSISEAIVQIETELNPNVYEG